MADFKSKTYANTLLVNNPLQNTCNQQGKQAPGVLKGLYKIIKNNQH